MGPRGAARSKSNAVCHTNQVVRLKCRAIAHAVAAGTLVALKVVVVAMALVMCSAVAVLVAVGEVLYGLWSRRR